VRGQLVSVATGNDRTLFFDFYPPPPARLLGVSLHIQIYTASGGIHNDATRRSLLAAADGILFMADSQRGREHDNIVSLEQMRNCLFDLNLPLDTLPLVLAWNKRDLSDALSVGELEAGLNINQAPSFATVAQVGQGIFESFRALASRALDSVIKRKPEVLHGGTRLDIGQSSDVVTSRRILAMQDTQRALSLLQGRYAQPLSNVSGQAPTSGSPGEGQSDAGPSGAPSNAPSSAPISTFSPGEPVPAAPQASSPSATMPDSPPSMMASSAKLVRSEVSAREEGGGGGAMSTRRLNSSGQRVMLEPIEAGRSGPHSAVPTDGNPPTAAATSGRYDHASQLSARDVWWSHLLPPGSLRAQLQDVERQVWSGQWSAGVRRAASIFYAMTAAEATREPDEGPAWRGLVLGLPVERYVRFRQAVQDAEAGKCSLEDGLFALFFLLDAALRKEAWLTRGA
jgi:hypothetical protein